MIERIVVIAGKDESLVNAKCQELLEATSEDVKSIYALTITEDGVQVTFDILNIVFTKDLSTTS